MNDTKSARLVSLASILNAIDRHLDIAKPAIRNELTLELYTMAHEHIKEWLTVEFENEPTPTAATASDFDPPMRLETNRPESILPDGECISCQYVTRDPDTEPCCWCKHRIGGGGSKSYWRKRP